VLGGTTLKIVQKEYELFLVQDSAPPVKMYFTSKSESFIQEVNAELQFQKNAEGIVDTILIRQGGQEFKAKRKL
jgi:hypothetical protein